VISNKAAAVLSCLCFLPASFQSVFSTGLKDFPSREQSGKAQRRLASWRSSIKDREAFMSSHYNKSDFMQFLIEKCHFGNKKTKWACYWVERFEQKEPESVNIVDTSMILFFL